jgi:hypothetical protein
MNITRLLPVAALLVALLPAQNKKSQDELKQLRTEKLAKEVFTKNPWQTDYDKARAAAKKDGKLLFAYFTRSYAN